MLSYHTSNWENGLQYNISANNLPTKLYINITMEHGTNTLILRSLRAVRTEQRFSSIGEYNDDNHLLLLSNE